MPDNSINLYGRIFIHGDVVTKTGLHIGGAQTSLAIGGVDNVVVRDPLTSRPYIPGSSLRGKMRSLAEKISGAPQNQPIGRDVNIHVAKTRQDYTDYWVNPVFGVPAESYVQAPTRLIVRDVFMSEESARELEVRADTDLPYTEVKWEAAIDRVTSAATPRQIERVPAGVRFSGFEMIFSVYLPEDVELFPHVLESMQLLEDDYLGGQGSRGSGKIAFENVTVSIKRRQDYAQSYAYLEEGESLNVANWLHQQEQLVGWLREALGFV